MSRRELRLVATAGLALAVVVGFLVWSLSTQEQEVAIDPRDLCPLDRAYIPGYSVVLLDVSEPVVGGNAKEFKRKLLEIGRALGKRGKLALFDIHDTSSPIISMCRPPMRSECDPKTAPRACKGVQEAYERTFEAPIVEQVGEFLSHQRERNVSPIIEAIKDVSLLTEFSAIDRDRPPYIRSLYVVSDMLQHAPDIYSHYGRVTSVTEFDDLERTVYYNRHKPDLRDVSVEVLYLLRRKYRTLQTSAHKAFWRAYFEASHALDINITNLNFAGGDPSAAMEYYPEVSGTRGSVHKGAPTADAREPAQSTKQAPVSVKVTAGSLSAFTVVAEPSTAVVRFTSHPEDYRSGIELPPGNYEVEVKAPGYESYSRVIRHGASPTTVRVALLPIEPDLTVPPESVEPVPSGEMAEGRPARHAVREDGEPTRDDKDESGNDVGQKIWDLLKRQVSDPRNEDELLEGRGR